MNRIFLIVFTIVFVLFCFNAFADGSIISSITQVDKKGLTINSKAQIYVKSSGNILIESGSGVSITAQTPIYYGMVSPAAGTNIPKCKIVYGTYSAKAAGQNVTLAAKAAFTNQSTYFVITQPYGADQPTAPTKVSLLSGTVFTIYGDNSSTGWFMAVGY